MECCSRRGDNNVTKGRQWDQIQAHRWRGSRRSARRRRALCMWMLCFVAVARRLRQTTRPDWAVDGPSVYRGQCRIRLDGSSVCPLPLGRVPELWNAKYDIFALQDGPARCWSPGMPTETKTGCGIKSVPTALTIDGFPKAGKREKGHLH